MTSPEAAALWIGLNAIFLIIISARVGQMRMKHKVSLGDGGKDEVQCAIRAQGNYVEYAPIALLGLFALAALGGSVLIIHLLGAIFLGARIAHFIGLGLGAWSQGRSVGTVFTLLTLLATALLLVFNAFT